jgi:hypothetical protein
MKERLKGTKEREEEEERRRSFCYSSCSTAAEIVPLKVILSATELWLSYVSLLNIGGEVKVKARRKDSQGLTVDITTRYEYINALYFIFHSQ